MDAALAGNATLDPARAHVVLMMFRNSAWRETDENIQGGRFLRGKFCDETRTTDCIVREREGGAAGYRHGGGIGWGRAPLAGVVQGQMGRVAVHRPRPDGGGVDLALLSVGAIAASAPVDAFELASEQLPSAPGSRRTESPSSPRHSETPGVPSESVNGELTLSLIHI